MSNVTNNYSAMVAASTNFGLLNQLMSSIGGVHADIVSSDLYNRGLPLLLRYYYKLTIRERIRQIVKEVLNGTFVVVRISLLLLLLIYSVCVCVCVRCCCYLIKEKIDKKRQKLPIHTPMTRFFDFFLRSTYCKQISPQYSN